VEVRVLSSAVSTIQFSQNLVKSRYVLWVVPDTSGQVAFNWQSLEGVVPEKSGQVASIGRVFMGG
jgi:hypothetical protein